MDFTALDEKYSYCLREFNREISKGNIPRALRIAMAMRIALFPGCDDPSTIRKYLFERFFRQLDAGYKCQYQSYDFEVIDYDMFEFSKSRHLFRGPLPAPIDLGSGKYITVMGAAQLFGRFHKRIFSDYAKESNPSISFLNLSLGGAGPEYFLNEEFISTANRGIGCIVQVLSGRSAGTENYPGMRMTKHKDMPESELADRLDIYREIFSKSPDDAVREIMSCQNAYTRLMNQLLASIKVPICLAWISSRAPSDWSIAKMRESDGEDVDFGLFPQLVDLDIWNSLKQNVSLSITVKDSPVPIKKFANELTGQQCPIFKWTGDGTVMWSESYYPSQEVHIDLASKLTDWIRKIANS